MSDDLKQAAKPDAARINVEQEHEVRTVQRHLRRCWRNWWRRRESILGRSEMFLDGLWTRWRGVIPPSRTPISGIQLANVASMPIPL